MPNDDLDDFDLGRTRAEAERETQAASPRPSPARASVFPLLLAGVAVVAVAGLVLVYFAFRKPARPEGALAAASTVPAGSTPAPSLSPSAPPEALPELDGSDEFVRRTARALSTHPELARWLAQSALVRTLTVVVVNIADGETPRPHLAFLAPAQRFRAAGRKGRIVPDPAGFAGYDRFADAVASLDPATSTATYRTLEPLFDAAYKDLGHPEGGFRGTLDRAIAALLAAPVPAPDVALVPHVTGFRYVDPRLEALTPAQRQFLRLGARNVGLIQAKLRELQLALASTH